MRPIATRLPGSRTLNLPKGHTLACLAGGAALTCGVVVLSLVWAGPVDAEPTPMLAIEPVRKPAAAPARVASAVATPAIAQPTAAPTAAEPTAPAETEAAAPASLPRFHLTAPRPTYRGRPIRPARTIRMRVTAYSPDARSCGKWADGITASGRPVTFNAGRLVAADTDLLPFGSLVSIPGYADGEAVEVLDRGGAIKGQRLDVLYPTHDRAMQWGVQHLDVTVWEYADR